MPDLTSKLKNLEIFHTLPERQLTELAKEFSLKHIKNKETLFHEGAPLENLYIILYGSFKIQKSFPGGSPAILNFLGRGEFLGISAVDLTNPTHGVTAVAIEDSALLACTRSFFKLVLMQIPLIRQGVQIQLLHRFQEFQTDRCLEQVRLSQRLADFLLRMWERQGSLYGNKIQIPFTRKEISQRLDTHTETIIRILSEWTKKDIIATVDHHIEILDADRLRRIRDHRPKKEAQGLF